MLAERGGSERLDRHVRRGRLGDEGDDRGLVPTPTARPELLELVVDQAGEAAGDRRAIAPRKRELEGEKLVREVRQGFEPSSVPFVSSA